MLVDGRASRTLKSTLPLFSHDTKLRSKNVEPPRAFCTVMPRERTLSQNAALYCYYGCLQAPAIAPRCHSPEERCFPLHESD